MGDLGLGSNISRTYRRDQKFQVDIYLLVVIRSGAEPRYDVKIEMALEV